ncbi:MAG: hypothetical protein U0163_11830 [Gemmatimonadaceae bacterium]
MNFSPDAQVVAQNGPALISAPNWYQPQSYLIGAVDDAVVEPLIHPGKITHTLASADAFYNNSIGILNANVTDNDGNADLVLSITAAPPPISLNQVFSVGFRDKNNGPTLSTGATFTVPGSPAFKLQSTVGATCAPSGGNLICQLAGTASGGQVNFTLTFKAVQRGTFGFTLTLTGQQPDPNTANNSLTRSITVN